MAEFSEVMKQAKRMCNAFGATSCHGCPCESVEECMLTGVPEFTSAKQYADVEKNVMKWAAENPEPRYPSLRDAWTQLFPASECIPCLLTHFGAIRQCTGDCKGCSARPIPAEIAEKLGVKPIKG